MIEQLFSARERELAQAQMFSDCALPGQGHGCFVITDAGSGDDHAHCSPYCAQA